ncbi:MAG: serine hydrolase [Lachnospiraceae bacterium]|nr:serine hydrolase [Lachnospiraceae bacterium]
MKPFIRRLGRIFTASLLSLHMILSPLQIQPVYATETHTLGENLTVYVDDHAPGIVRTLHYEYANNRYLSLRDLGALLTGSAGSFSLSLSGKQFDLTTGVAYTPAGGENTPFEEPLEYATKDLSSMNLNVNGEAVKYYTFMGTNAAGNTDCFVSITDLPLILDIQMWIRDDALFINTGEAFQVDLPTWAQEGFFQEVYSALTGDASTGDIYYSYMAALSVPVASTSKLMTLLCIMDAINAGTISITDTVVISEKAAALSQTEDGVIKMEAGMTCMVEELLYGLMLPSSNECALALAEHLCGSEEAFVTLMNSTAVSLGLSEGTIFYNPNGLPAYSDSVAATKMQNHMTASDMFLLVRHLLTTYPQVIRITSQKEQDLPSFELTVKNTNPLLYNMKDVIGLKTGTTNMAGACLVSAMEVVDNEGNPHMLIAMEFGGEDNTVRTTMSQLLLTYARQVLLTGNAGGSELTPLTTLPASAEELIRLVVRSMD